MEKINIIEFLPYYPPHVGGVENVSYDISTAWQEEGLGQVINVITSVGQNYKDQEKVIFEGYEIGYIDNSIINLVIPSIDIINNFPCYKLLTKQKRLVFKYLSAFVGDNRNTRVITHTRFFLTSLWGGRFAKKKGLKWIHIEHGSSFTSLGNIIFSFLSKLYDRFIGKSILVNADKVFAISEASKQFVLSNFVNRDIEVLYRGFRIPLGEKEKKGDIVLAYIGRLVKSKGVHDLIVSYKELGIRDKLIIIGDGEEKKKLEKEGGGYNIEFLGKKSNNEVLDFLLTNNVILINPSFSEGLPTTVVEGLLTRNVVIASNVGGTSEISSSLDLILFKPGDTKMLRKQIVFALKNYPRLKGLSYNIVEKKFDYKNSIMLLYNLIR